MRKGNFALEIFIAIIIFAILINIFGGKPKKKKPVKRTARKNIHLYIKKHDKFIKFMIQEEASLDNPVLTFYTVNGQKIQTLNATVITSPEPIKEFESEVINDSRSTNYFDANKY